MGLRDLIFGKEEDDDENTSEELEETSKPKERPPVANPRFSGIDEPIVTPKKPQVAPVPEPEIAVSSPELEAELKEMKELMQMEKKEKGLGQEYYGYLKALGDEDDDDARQRTLRSVNAVREQFSIGQALTWNSLVESAKTCMGWLSNHSRQKLTKLQTDHRTVSANFSLQAEKAAIAIQESEEKIKRLQREIEDQKRAQQAAKDAQKKADQEFERKKLAIDNASVKLATDIANDIAAFQRQH
jgi:hypothetical protein